MEAFLTLLLRSFGILTIFLGCYWLFLRKETFFNANRGFLVLGLLCSVVLPFVEFTREVTLAPVLLDEVGLVEDTAIANSQSKTTFFNWPALLLGLYLTGVAFFLSRTLLQVLSLHRLTAKGKKNTLFGIRYIVVKGQIPPFSFFNSIVYDPSLHTEEELKQILNHETVHCKQWHSVDLLLAEFLLILQWMNPVAWLYKKSVQQNLEFIADRGALQKDTSRKTYQYTMLRTSLQPAYVNITTNFYNSLIKKRIVMMNQSPSNVNSLFKMLLLLPVLGGFLMSFNTKEVYVYPKMENQQEILANTNQDPIEITIDKNTTKEELDEIATELKGEGIDFSYKNLKYNDNNEITRISLKLKVENNGNRSTSESSFNKDGEPIEPVLIFHDPDNNTTFMGSASNRSKIHQSGRGHKIRWKSKGSSDDDVDIIREDGKTKIMLNGKEVSKEELRDHRIKMIKAKKESE